MSIHYIKCSKQVKRSECHFSSFPDHHHRHQNKASRKHISAPRKLHKMIEQILWLTITIDSQQVAAKFSATVTMGK